MSAIQDSHAVQATDYEFFAGPGSPLLARVYRPGGAGPHPAIVDVHGGAWTSGTRLQNAAIHQALAASGILVAALDFHMPPESSYPAPVADINLGIRWLKTHAAEFDIRADNIGGLGTSSGGHQLLLNALRPNDARYAALPCAGTPAHGASLAYAIACWPVADPLARYRMAEARGVEHFLNAHHAYWPSVAAMEEGNPVLLLERGEPAALPPLLLIQGTSDDNLTPDMSDRLAAAYSKAGGAVELHKFDGEPHAFIVKNMTTPHAVEAMALIESFILRHSADRRAPQSYKENSHGQTTA